MQVLVNGVRLFFDVEGARLVPDGPAMRPLHERTRGVRWLRVWKGSGS
jgi:hypothetical protein